MLYVRTKSRWNAARNSARALAWESETQLGLVSSTARGRVVGVSCPVQAKRVHFRWRILKE